MSYSPTLERWLQPDPTGAQYIDGLNLYQPEKSNPVNEVDPTGLAGGSSQAPVPPNYSAVDYQKQRAIFLDQNIVHQQQYIVHQEVAVWKRNGNNFAAALMDAFVRNAFPTGDAGLAFNAFAPEIKASPEYRDPASHLLMEMARLLPQGLNKIPDSLPTPGGPAWLKVDYGGRTPFSTDLGYALGNAYFGYRDLTITVTGKKFSATGTFIQKDDYRYKGDALFQLFPTYHACWELQHGGPATHFVHHEEWQDTFTGTITAPPHPVCQK